MSAVLITGEVELLRNFSHRLPSGVDSGSIPCSMDVAQKNQSLRLNIHFILTLMVELTCYLLSWCCVSGSQSSHISDNDVAPAVKCNRIFGVGQ